MTQHLKRGQVIIAKLNPNVGHEIGKIRPVIILTDDLLLSSKIPMVMVTPLSTQYWPELAALRVQISPRERLLKTSYAVIEQTRSIDATRLSVSDVLTELTSTELNQLESQLKYLIGLG